LEQKQFSERLENEYAAGVTALKMRDWTRAIVSFEKVLAFDRNFRDASKRLAEAQSQLERESTETILGRYYADGVAALQRDDLGAALAALEKVHKINPNYRNVAGLLAEVESALTQKTEPAAIAAASSAPLDSLYQSALASLQKEDWLQAMVTLEKLQLLQPTYRDVVDRLAYARANLHQAGISGSALLEQTGSRSSFYIGGAIVALMVLPLLGFIVFSSTVRAHFYFWRGDYAAAAEIYEKLLVRYPQRAKLYVALANIYFLMGRSDERAMRVYKMVLQLNLATRNREEINSLVAQRYLTEGRTDTDAIEVLEDALKVEQHKKIT